MRRGILLILLMLFAFKDANAFCRGWTLEIDELYAEQVWIKWTDYSDPEEGATFTVEFKEFNKNWTVLESDIKTNAGTKVTTFLKGGLKPSTEYSLRVRRKCSGGSNLFKQLTFTTRSKDDPPTSVCDGKWFGDFTSFKESKNSILISWSDGGYSAFYTVWYSRGLSDEWKALNPQINLEAIIPNLESNELYKIRVVRTCPENDDDGKGGLNDTDRYISTSQWTKSSGIDNTPINFCGGLWFGLDDFPAYKSPYFLTVRWDEDKDAKFRVRIRYIGGADISIGGKKPSKKWETKVTSMSGNILKINGLLKGASYEVEVSLLCSGKVDDVDKRIYKTASSFGPDCGLVQDLTTNEITYNSANISGNFQNWGTYKGASTYIIHLWEKNDQKRKLVINRRIFYGPSLGTSYSKMGGLSSGIGDPPLKPNTDYVYFIEHVCGLNGEITVKIASPGNLYFRTLPGPKGACGCTVGNKTVPSASNSAATHFYCGSVTGAATITESSGRTTFKSKVVELNPGFETHISGTGSFVAVAFDPNTCQESAAAAPQKGQQSATQKMSAPDNAVSKASVRALKKHTVYPNPNRGSFSIDFKEKQAVIKSVTVYDMFGVRVLHKRYNRRLDVEQYSLRRAKSGLYKITIRTASGVEYESLLVEF